jgi:hypothetical protein
MLLNHSSAAFSAAFFLFDQDHLPISLSFKYTHISKILSWSNQLSLISL